MYKKCTKITRQNGSSDVTNANRHADANLTRKYINKGSYRWRKARRSFRKKHFNIKTTQLNKKQPNRKILVGKWMKTNFLLNWWCKIKQNVFCKFKPECNLSPAKFRRRFLMLRTRSIYKQGRVEQCLLKRLSICFYQSHSAENPLGRP